MQNPESPPDATQPEAEHSYPPRVCRICLEVVHPTLQPSQFFHKPRVVYVSEDPESGRLLRPCKCKGSSRYVHEGCLQTWRLANPQRGGRNFWECPTCRFQYRLQRLTWGRWISSAGTQILLTIGILLLTIFLLGFVADPIIDFYVGSLEVDLDMDEEKTSWPEHFLKGLAVLGITSFSRALFTLSPFSTFRPTGIVTPGRSTTGRNRAASISWLFIVLGVASFLWSVYKTVRSWSQRVLERVGAKVMDVPLPDDNEDETEEPSTHPKDE